MKLLQMFLFLFLTIGLIFFWSKRDDKYSTEKIIRLIVYGDITAIGTVVSFIRYFFINKLMTLYEFITLNKTEKANAVWDGLFIANRTDKEYKYQLYNLGSFFVEVTYDSKSNEILNLRPFKTSMLLEPYLNQISIEGELN